MFTTLKYSFENFGLYDGNHGWNQLLVSAVGVDARVIRGEVLHLVEAVLDRIGLGLVAQVPFAGEVGASSRSS